MKKIRKNEQGITLIALVVTIILLLILSFVTLSMFLGEKGLFQRVHSATKDYDIEQYREIIETTKGGADIDSGIHGLTEKEYMQRYYEDLVYESEKGSLQGSGVSKLSDTMLKVVTEEGYVFTVTKERVKYEGKQGETVDSVPEINNSNIDIEYDPSEWTSSKVKVSIKANVNTEGYYLKYTIDKGVTWKEYKEPFEVDNNGVEITVKLENLLGESRGVATGNVVNIDRKAPKTATVTARNVTNKKVTITAEAEDEAATTTDGKSNIYKYELYVGGTLRETKKTESATENLGRTTFEIATAFDTPLSIYIKAYDRAENSKQSNTVQVSSLEIGAEVLYTPKTKDTKYTLKGAMSGYGTYSNDENNSSLKVLTKPQDQTISQENFTWKVMSIDEKSGEVKLMGVPIDNHENITFQGALGYNNGAYLLDEICRTLYSNTELGVEARSIDLKDIEEGMNEYGISENQPSEETRSYTDKSGLEGTPTNYYPKLYGFQKDSGVDVTDAKNLKSEGIDESYAGGEKEGIPINKDDTGEKVSDQGYTQPKTQNLMVKQSYNNDIESQQSGYYKDEKFFNLVFGTNKFFWLASRFCYFYPDNDFNHFGLRAVGKNNLYIYGIFRSSGGVTRTRMACLPSSYFRIRYNTNKRR